MYANGPVPAGYSKSNSSFSLDSEMPSAERHREFGASLGVRAISDLFAYICAYLRTFALKPSSLTSCHLQQPAVGSPAADSPPAHRSPSLQHRATQCEQAASARRAASLKSLLFGCGLRLRCVAAISASNPCLLSCLLHWLRAAKAGRDTGQMCRLAKRQRLTA